MNIRTQLTLRFILIAALIMLMASILIYVLSAEYRRDDFYSRLQNKANNTAKLLIEVDEVDVNLLTKIEENNPVSLPNEKIVIFDYQDSILFSTDRSQIITIDSVMLARIRLEDELRWEQSEFEALGFLFKGPFDRFVVVAAAQDIYGYKRLRNLALILGVVLAFSVIVVSLAGWIYAGKALQPIAKVVQQVDEISIANLNLRVDEGNGKDEISKLAQTFNSMLARLESAFGAQKTFIANASHELRTPLTAITGQLEVTLLKPRQQEEYSTVIHSVLDDIKSLNRLSNRLLLLAQSSAEEGQRKMTLVRIDEVLWLAVDDVMRLNHGFSANLDLAADLDDESALTVKGDEQLLRTAFANVIENGCKYSDRKSIDVYVKSSRFGVTILFRDEGVGIPTEDLTNVFEPFFRGTNTSNIKGTGIGLSLVKGIVRLHHGVIQITSETGAGTTVTVSLPIVRREQE